MVIGLDFDGTLLDSRERHKAALRHVAVMQNAPLSEKDIESYFRLKCDGLSGLEALRRMNISNGEEISRQWLEIIETPEMLALDKLYPDTFDALKRQLQQQKDFVLVTGRRDAPAVLQQIDALGLKEFLNDVIVVDPRDASQMKAEVTRRHSLAAIVGDTEIDWQWAKDLNVDFYASSYGFRSRDYWEKRQVTSYDSLPAIFNALNAQALKGTMKIDR